MQRSTAKKCLKSPVTAHDSRNYLTATAVTLSLRKVCANASTCPLTELALGKERDTKEMSAKGDSLIEEQTDNEYYIYLLSGALLNDAPFCAELPADLDEDTRYIIRRALRVSDIIDSL